MICRISLSAQNVAAVLIDRRNGSTARFCGSEIRDILDAWASHGWLPVRDTANCTLLATGDIQHDDTRVDLSKEEMLP